MQFKTKARCFRVFCLLVQFAAYPMGGIQLQHCGDEQCHHPVVVHVVDVVSPPKPDEVALVCKHEQGGQQEANVACYHDAPEPPYGQVVAFVALLELHEHKGQRPHGKNVWRPPLQEDVGCTADDHHHGTGEENKAFCIIQLSHLIGWIWLVRRRLARRCLRRPSS